MLYLNPPYFVINGVSVFPDDSDPLQFYYLPMMPHLTMGPGSNGSVLPLIQLIEYTARPEPAGSSTSTSTWASVQMFSRRWRNRCSVSSA